jgi:sugar phosphate permease
MLIPVGRSGWAIAAGYMGLFSIMIIPAPLAIIFGLIALRDIKKHPDRHGMGRAIFGIVMGVLAIGFVAISFLRMLR